MAAHLAYLKKLDEVAAGPVAARAAEVDQSGAFPQHSIDALAKAGLLGLVSATAVGGMGQAHRAAALAVERLDRDGRVHALRRRGHARVLELEREMDAGRQRRLLRLGFSAAEAEALSALHTRNFM